MNASGAAPFLLTGDHGGRLIPHRLGTLGLGAADLDRHIACDLGVAELGALLATRLDAPFVHQAYSRLVIDCNRDPESPDAIPSISDGTPIPGNLDLSASARAERVAAIHQPYQATIAEMISARQSRGLPTILVALHSFTPQLAGVVRPWHVGVLHDGANETFAKATLRALRRESRLVVGDNEPYKMDATDHSVPRHAFAAGLAYVELEIRQDLLSNDAGLKHWTDVLALALCTAQDDARQPDTRSD